MKTKENQNQTKNKNMSNVETINAVVNHVNVTISYGKKIYSVELDKTFPGYNIITGNYLDDTNNLVFPLKRLIATCCKHIQYFDRLMTAKLDKRQNLDIDLINAILSDAEITFENKFFAAGEIYEIDGNTYTIKQDRYIFEIKDITVSEKVEMLLFKRFGKVKSLASMLDEL